jgi:hypothetical protein
MKKLLNLFSLFSFLLLFGCGGSGSSYKTPVDDLIKQMSDDKNFSIILYDMEFNNGFFSDTYKHKYRVVREKADGTPYSSETDWFKVNRDFFEQNANNMGMEIATKMDGKVTKNAAPPGYNRYVGNNRYGNWRTGSNGMSFWEFYGQYAFMSSMLNLMTPIYRTSYYDYRDNYRGRSSYYGTPSSRGYYQYGTYGRNNYSKTSTLPRVDSKPSGFKNKVNSMVTRSSSSPYSSSYSGTRTHSRYTSSTYSSRPNYGYTATSTTSSPRSYSSSSSSSSSSSTGGFKSKVNSSISRSSGSSRGSSSSYGSSSSSSRSYGTSTTRSSSSYSSGSSSRSRSSSRGGK